MTERASLDRLRGRGRGHLAACAPCLIEYLMGVSNESKLLLVVSTSPE